MPDSRPYIKGNSRDTAWLAVRDNKAQNRFELDVEGAVAFANYRLTPSAVIITHTETPRALRGRGIASELVKGALELIRADGLKVIAGCGFVVDYLRKHPDLRIWRDGVYAILRIAMKRSRHAPSRGRVYAKKGPRDRGPSTLNCEQI